MPTDFISSVRDAVANNTIMHTRHSIQLICSDRLSSLCNKVARVGSQWFNLITDLFNETCDFFGNFVAPIIWHAIDLAKDLLNIALSSSGQTIAAVTQQTMVWIKTSCGDRFCRAHDLAEVISLNANILVKRFATAYRFIHLAQLATVLVIIVFMFRKLSRNGKSKSKRNLRQRQRSLETHLGFLHWDEDDDDDHTFYTRKRSKSANSLDLDYPTPSSDFNRSRDHCTGSSSVRLHPLKGPAATTLTFRAYAPPSVDKEIPKVDLVGALQFVKTGNVRSFVHMGAKRLLVLNFHDMTLEIYIPKERNEVHSKQTKHQGKNNPSHEVKKTKTRRSGIHIMSNRNLLDQNEPVHEDSDDDENNEAWDPRNFKPCPAVVITLCQLVSISALPPKQSSALEISYRIATTPVKKTARKSASKEVNTTSRELGMPPNEDDTVDSRQKSPLAVEEACVDAAELAFHRQDILPQEIPTTLHSFDSFEVDPGTIKNNTAVIHRRDEFSLLSPHDAAEFQRIVMALRTSGREISQLYEMLEEVHANTEAHFPQVLHSSSANQGLRKTKDVDGKGRCCEAPQFRPPGVALDDAWRCMNEIPSLREGLIQYHQQSYQKFGSKYSDMIAAAAASGAKNGNPKEEGTGSENEPELDEDTKFRQQIAHFYATTRSLLGIVDFVFLFINPLPLDATPYATPCASSDALLNRDGESDMIGGIDLHHQRLQGFLQLQRLVRRTALYVIAYCEAKSVVQEGWHLRSNKVSSAGNSPTNTNDGSGVQEESIAQNEEGHFVAGPNQVNMKRLAFDNDRDNWSHDVQVRNECYEASVGKDVSVIMNGKCSRYQGFALVGLQSFHVPLANSSPEQAWLDPKLDPVDSLPSLRGMIEKYPDRQFLVVSNFNEYSSIAVCLLFVRSLPVGVDPAFDHALRELFANNLANERRERLQISFQIAFVEGWSSLKKILIRTVLSTIFRWFSKDQTISINKGTRELLSCPLFLVRNFATVRYFGGIQPEESNPKNYISITVQLSSGSFKSWFMRYLLTNRKDVRNQGLIYDVSYALEDDTCERVLATARMIHMDANSAMPLDYRDHSKVEERTVPLSMSRAAALLKSTSQKQVIHRASSNDELYSNEIDAVFEILDGVEVPRRLLNNNAEIVIQNELVRLNLSRSDIERYLIACACDVQAAGIRIVESCAWRGKIFPVNLKSCRIELCSGQCFQQGHDKEQNPIFYFRHMLPGPWLNDVDSGILAVLHRLESYFQRTTLLKPGVKITVIILLGTGLEKQRVTSEPTQDQRHSTPGDGNVSNEALLAACDPMIDPNQEYTNHGSIEMFSNLIVVLRRHYPERLQRALVIPGGGWSKSKIRDYVLAQQILTPRVIILNSLQEVKHYVHDDQLVTFAGGKAPVTRDAFTIH